LRYSISMMVLLLAAVLEAGGDALMRNGLQAPSAGRRLLFLLAGGFVLSLYGYTVNAPPWDFGRLLGTYAVFFFVVAQAINWIAFGQKPTPSLVFGGILIVAGGVVVSLNR
jgi:drug/metabolite transporter superfamily protein YnfA